MINELAFLTDERQLTSRVIRSPCQKAQLHMAVILKLLYTNTGQRGGA